MKPLPNDEFTVDLSDDDVAFFNEHGYLQIPQVTTPAEIEWLAELYDGIFANREGEAEGLQFDLGGKRGHDGDNFLSQMLVPELKYPELFNTVFVRNTRRIAQRLLGVGEDVDLKPFGHMILKPARIGRETPWHQDEAYWEPDFTYRGLSVWMPLEDATVESGCMHFVPGTHTHRVHEHRHIDDDPKVHGLMTVDIHPEGAVPVPVPAGGASVHHCRILHYAGPNRTNRNRRAYIQSFTAPIAPVEGAARRPWLEAEKEALAKSQAAAGARAN